MARFVPVPPHIWPDRVVFVKAPRCLSDGQCVTFRLDVSASRAPLADVIPLVRLGSGGAQLASPGPEDSPELEVARAREALARDIDLLHRRYGDRWPEIPPALGRSAATAEALLVCGPTALDPATGSPIGVATGARLLVPPALTLADRVVEEAEVLGEALGTEIVGLPLRRLDEVVGAVMDLGLVSFVEPAWASPVAADAADVVLGALGAELRATTLVHDELYACFTDHVLEIPEARLRAGGRPWRLVARARLRRDLASASRTGRVPGGLRAVAHQVLEVSEARRRLTFLAPLLSTHLGRSGWGPLTDADSVAASLAAVRRFQRVLGDRLDRGRLAGLLAAGAFQSAELVVPATNLRTALRRWQIDVASLCAGDPWAIPANELANWAVRTGAVLSAITTGAGTMADIDRAPATVRVLVDDLLLRENVAELGEWLDARENERRASRRAEPGSAS